MVYSYLVDSKVQRFSSWREDLHKEDLRDVGSVVPRTNKALLQLYNIYKEFQTSKEVVARRKELLEEE